MGSIGVPVFYGGDPERWVEWIDAFVVTHNFTVFKTRQLPYGFIEGDALSWYGDEISRYGFSNWDELKVRLLNRFSTRVDSVDGGDDIIIYSNQLIRYVKRDMLILDLSVMVQENDDSETETLLFEEDNRSKTEMDSGAYQVFEKILKRRKKIIKNKRSKGLFSDIKDRLVEILNHKESDNSDMLGIQMENTNKRQRKSWLEWSKGSCHCAHTREKLDRKWMLMFRETKMCDEFVKLWTDQKELANLHSEIPTMYRHEINRIIAHIFIYW
ncbi:Uncharacterized protein Rs2_15906 [Raphanus sativus]|nr:Uncharacterized protein Rs2_15906 [Raphanus sativus]